MSTNAHEPALAAITTISGKEKLSLAQQKDVESTIRPVLSDTEGASAIIAALRPTIPWSRTVLRVLVSETIRQFKEAGNRMDRELQSKLGVILLAIALRDKVNSDARWMALSGSLRLEFTGAFDALRDSLQQLAPEAADKYLKYAFHQVTPDGGLPYLLQATRLSFPAQPLNAVIEKVALEVGRRDQVASATADALCRFVSEMTNKRAADWQGTERAILFLSVKVAGGYPQLNASLSKLRNQLERTEWEAGDWRHHVLANINRLNAMPVRSDEPSIGAKEPDKTHSSPPKQTEEGPTRPSVPDSLTEVITTLDGATTSAKRVLTEQASRIEQLRSDLRDRNSTIKALKESFNQFELQASKTSAQIKELESERTSAVQDSNRLRTENELIAKRCQQDIARAEIERDSTLTTFKSKLWQELQPCLVEAQNDSHVPEQLSEESRIFLRRLRDIVYVLQKQDVR